MASASGIAEQARAASDDCSDSQRLSDASARLAKHGRSNELSLASLPSFAELGPDDLRLLEAKTTVMTVPRGTVLLRRGDPSEKLYLVRSGRFFVMPEGKQDVIAEIGPGEPLGELAFFAGVERTANVVAARESKVLVLTRDAYAEVIRQVPGIVSTILAAVADRLARVTGASPALRAKPARTVAFLPIGERTRLPDGLVATLAGAIAPGSAVAISSKSFPGDAGDESALRGNLAALERETDLLLFELGRDDTTFTRTCLSVADQLVLVAHDDERDSAAITPTDFERQAAALFLPSHRSLIILRDRAAAPITGTLAWLEPRDVKLHHHVALDDRRDLERLGRFLSGTAVGFVLGGGTALGCAHLGVAKALIEAGETLDCFGGTSSGSAMAGALAMGLAPDEILDLTFDIFVDHRAMRRLTIPLYSLLDHHVLDRRLARHYAGTNIEDLPFNFFAVAASLTDNDGRVLRRGPTWEAVRASGALPGVLPPFITEDGEVLVDGALIDNVPVAIMRDLKLGPNVVVRLRPPKQWRVPVDYGSFPTRGGIVRQMLTGRWTHEYPTLGAVIMRSLVVTSEHHPQVIDFENDFYIVPRGTADVGYLDWHRGREMAEQAYRHMAALLAEAGSLTALIQSQESEWAA